MIRDTISHMNEKILIVEDEPDIREAMAEAMAEAGYQVSTAENGLVGLTLAQAEHPDLILLDIKMPVLDGLGMLDQLRLDDWGMTVKVIMLTAMDDMQNIADAHEKNIKDYVIKAHHSLDEIILKVKNVLFAE